MSTGGEPANKEFDLTGMFQGSTASQMNQAMDYISKWLESKGLAFNDLRVSYQGHTIGGTNRGAMSPQSDAEREMDAMANQMRAKRPTQNATPALKEGAADPITQFASNAHEEWRRNFDPTGTKPRIKKNSDGTEGDINVPFEKLHPDWKKENLAAGHAAHHAVKHFGRDMEKAAEHVHNEWMKRNPKADYNAAQHVPYDHLSDDEKEKDRVHVRTMMRLMGHHPKQGVAEVAPPGAKAERMVRHIKQGYAKDGKLTPQEKSIAFATAWKAHNAGQVEEQGVAEGYKFKGGFPFDVDHMHGSRGINLPSVETKRYFTDKQKWEQTVDELNHSLYDDNSEFIGATGRSTVTINGREWARWSDARQKGYVETKTLSQDIAEGYTGRETKAGTWRVFKDGNAVAAAGPFKSADEAAAWIKKHKQGITEMDKSEPSAGRDTGPRPGPDRAAKPVTAKKATKDMGDMLTRAFKDSHKKKDVKEGEIEQTKTGIRHRGDRYGSGEELPNGGGNRSGFPNPGKYARDLDNLDKGLTSKLDHSMGVSWPKGRKKQDMDENINPLMLKLKRALIKEGRVKELADDLKTMNDADFMKKYGKAKAAIRKDMKRVDEAEGQTVYTAQEIIDVLTGKKTQQQVDAERAKKSQPLKEIDAPAMPAAPAAPAAPAKPAPQSNRQYSKTYNAATKQWTTNAPAANPMSQDPAQRAVASQAAGKQIAANNAASSSDVDDSDPGAYDFDHWVDNGMGSATPVLKSGVIQNLFTKPLNQVPPGAKIIPKYDTYQQQGEYAYPVVMGGIDQAFKVRLDQVPKGAKIVQMPNPGGNLYKGLPTSQPAAPVNEQAAMPPDQAARLAPYLQKGADGSQYYNLPTTNPGETGAAMGQTNISPAALAQIKSPQGQQKIIQQLLAMTEPKNAVPQSTTTATDVSDQYAGGLNELSTNQLARYKTAAAKDAKAADQAGDFKRGDKRLSGMVQATKKQFDNDAKKVDESRAARRALMARIVNSR